MRRRLRARAAAIALSYAAFATLWILFSDRALLALTGDPGTLVRWSVAKGVAFVVVTALLLYLVVRKAYGALDASYGALQEKEVERRAHAGEAERIAEMARRERSFSDDIVESLPGVLYLYDEKGRFLRWNRNFLDVSGYSAEDVERMHPADFFAEEDRPALLERVAEVFAKGESTLEAPFRAKDGRRIPYFFTGRKLVFHGRTCLVGMGIDISQRVVAEQALRDMNERLEHAVAERTAELSAALVRAEAADRLKSSFLATMSHELRTPLNSIIGFTGIILQELAGPLNPEQAKQLGMVRASARHLLALINDVLDISKIEAGQLDVNAESFRAADSVGRIAEIVTPLLEAKGLSLRTEVPADLPEITSDRRRVDQILLNLVQNAIKFTDHGGVTVAVQHVPAWTPPDERGAVGSRQAPAIRFRVADTGIGIRPEDLASLFQPFHQVDSGLARQHEGTGLGLAICRRLTELLGGEIQARSEWGRGSTFVVTLPVAGRAGTS